MLRLVRLFIGTIALGAFVWWGLTAPLGERTLFGHLQAIGQSKESQDLVRGTKQKVGDLTKRLGAEGEAGEKPRIEANKEAAKDAPAEPKPAAKDAPPQEKLTPEDRRRMRKLLDSARAHVNTK